MKKSDFDPKNKIFLGIGNNSSEYEKTYHNIGVIALLSISGSNINELSNPSKKHFSYIEMDKNVYAINETFMNNAGSSAREIIDYFDKKPNQLVVLHDDSDMTIGSFKISYNQRSAGHHGIDSIISEIKTNEFYRIKIGIRPQREHIRKKAEEFVLKKISKTDLEIFNNVFIEIKKSVGI